MPNTFDVNAYLAANPDLAANWNSGGIMTQLGSTLQDAAQAQWDRTGQYEVANGGRGSGQTDYAVTPPVAAASPYAVTPAKTGNADTTGDLTSADAPPAASPSGAPTGYSYQAPQLTAANGQYATPYYSTTTDNGDFAGAVMVGQNQQIRLVDGKTGDIIYQGTGPEAAQVAAGVANGVSQDKGKKAAWAIQADNGDQGWVTQAEDNKDTKHSLLGSLADIALPILGAVFAPVTGGLSAIAAAGLGAAGGSALSSVLQGRSLSDTLLRASLSGAGGALGAGIVGAGVGSTAGATGGATGSAAGAAGTSGALGSAVGGATAGALPGTIGELVVNGVAQSALPAALASGAGALAGSVGSGMLQGSSGSDTLQPQGQAPTTVDEVTVTAQRLARQGFNVQGLVAQGIPLAVANQAVQSVGGDTVEGVDVVANPKPQVDVAAAVPPISVPSGITTPAAIGAGLGAGTLMSALTSGDPSKVVDWAKANPTAAAGLGLSVAGLIGGSPGSTGKYSIPVGASGTGAAPQNFAASLPASNLAVRQPRDMSGTDWNHYAFNPEKSFFSNVPQHFAKGGDVHGDSDLAVRGHGDGRSDSIDAKLSDGEYVMDAETVGMLGNGSSTAGARKLDQFRVNIRKHKGKSLARGRFSVNAKDPEAYLSEGIS